MAQEEAEDTRHSPPRALFPVRLSIPVSSPVFEDVATPLLAFT
jgi:hypothetical protein